MTSRERIKSALAHKESDRLPLDFGCVTVTGMHYSVVEGLREHFGLEKHPIKIAEPYQMLGLIEDDLKAAMGVDAEGVFTRANMFGIRQENWREWRLDNGDVVLAAGGLNVTEDHRGDHFIHP